MNKPLSGEWRHFKLGDLLVDAGAISKETLSASLEEQKISRMRLGEILLKNGWLTERQLADALSRQLKLPLISLAKYKPAPEAIKIIPDAVATFMSNSALVIIRSSSTAMTLRGSDIAMAILPESRIASGTISSL